MTSEALIRISFTKHILCHLCSQLSNISCNPEAQGIHYSSFQIRQYSWKFQVFSYTHCLYVPVLFSQKYDCPYIWTTSPLLANNRPKQTKNQPKNHPCVRNSTKKSQEYSIFCTNNLQLKITGWGESISDLLKATIFIFQCFCYRLSCRTRMIISVYGFHI